MSFLWPLGFAFAALGGVVVVLHMLKMKRREVDISSALLWKKAIEDLRANAPFQRLRKSLLLLLQLLAVLGLAVALARPVRRMPKEQGRRIAILVDVSASMGTREAGGKTRVDLAREEARKVIDGLGPNDAAAIVAFDQRARALATLTTSQPVLRQALAELAPTHVGSEAREGLALAAAILREAAGGEILLVSDGGFPPPGDVDLRGAPVRYLPVGAPRENAGITGLDVRRMVDESEAIEV
ncbi:MAG TPA: VWA domain-containing protein, partial [Planctomycetota bacterium]|nr:VWA domain-containing protein [Planctomycetota bacterium]